MRGFNIVQIARNQDKLNATQELLLETNPKIEVHNIKFDFDVPFSNENYGELRKQLLKLEDVSIIVNNVGVIGYAPLEVMSMKSVSAMVNVNCIPQVFLAKTFLPRLIKRGKEGKRCAIINLSAVSQFTKSPGTAVYSASKAYNHIFSQVLKKEVEGENIDVLSVTAGPTVSNMVKYHGKELIIIIHRSISYLSK
jgi:short-subunit dehydrogenase